MTKFLSAKFFTRIIKFGALSLRYPRLDEQAMMILRGMAKHRFSNDRFSNILLYVLLFKKEQLSDQFVPYHMMQFQKLKHLVRRNFVTKSAKKCKQ